MDAEARRAINRLNAQKSTGPTTAEGKARSRQNALKHGLTATVVDPAGGPAAPGGGVGPDWVAEQVARAQAQITRAQRIEAKLRGEAAWRAECCWDGDRQVEAEELGADLRRAPGRTVARLRRTPQGCDWLSERWQILARAARVERAWDEEETRLAFDLLGAPSEGRGWLPSVAESRADEGRQLAELARTALEGLAEDRAAASAADEVEQALAVADCRDTPTRELARLRRYELALVRRLRWLLAAGGDQATGPDPAVSPAAASAVPVEPTEPGAPGETNRIEAAPTPIDDAAAPPETPRRRPDLARLERQDRQRRRQAGRNRRLA